MLQVEKLHQFYGGSHILRGLSFEVKVGEVTCLLGRNGVGKTTLLIVFSALIGLALWLLLERTRFGALVRAGSESTETVSAIATCGARPKAAPNCKPTAT